MVTNRNKFVLDIKKIVGIDPNQSSLDRAIPKASIGSFRGIALPSPTGTGGSSGQTTTPDQNAGNILTDGGIVNPPELLQPLDPLIATNKTDPKNPTEGAYAGGQGTLAAKDIIDGTVNTPIISDGVQVGMAGDYLKNGGTLNGISGAMDCKTGKSLDIRTDGLDKPPPGWYQAGIPDVLGNIGPLGYLSWEAGVEWLAPWAVSGGPSIASNAQDAAKAARDASGDSSKSQVIDTTLDSNFPHSGGVLRWIFTFQDPDTMNTASYYAQDQGCTPTFGSSTCPLVNPTKWPGDGTTQVIRQSDGTFKISQFENPGDIVPAFTDGMHSRVDFCFDSGRTGSIIPAINGGYMVTETVTQGGTPEGIIRLFDSDNKVTAYLDGTNYANYLPKS